MKSVTNHGDRPAFPVETPEGEGRTKLGFARETQRPWTPAGGAARAAGARQPDEGPRPKRVRLFGVEVAAASSCAAQGFARNEGPSRSGVRLFGVDLSATALAKAQRLFGADLAPEEARPAEAEAAGQSSPVETRDLRHPPCHGVEQLVHDLRTKLPKQSDETSLARAARIYHAEAQIRALAVTPRVKLLGALTGARQDDLRQERGVGEPLQEEIKQLKDEILKSLPKNMAESMMNWARRIYEAKAEVRQLPDEARFDLLSQLTAMRARNFYGAPFGIPLQPDAQRVAESIRTRRPAQEGETRPAWARRIFREELQLRELPHDQCVKILSWITGAQLTTLEFDPALWDERRNRAPEIEEHIRSQLPQQPGEPRLDWVRRICRTTHANELTEVQLTRLLQRIVNEKKVNRNISGKTLRSVIRSVRSDSGLGL